jgi:hypothetical protein
VSWTGGERRSEEDENGGGRALPLSCDGRAIGGSIFYMPTPSSIIFAKHT